MSCVYVLITNPQKKRKRKDADDNADESETSSVGVSGLKQAISAMEHWRLNNQHLYKDIPEAQIGLRTDPRIKAFESAASHKEPERVKMAHSLKAKGSSAGECNFGPGTRILSLFFNRHIYVRGALEMLRFMSH
jgi:hypothetical protein